MPAYRFHEQYRFNRAELLDWATARRMGVAPEAFHEPETAAIPLPSLGDALSEGGIIYRLEGKNRDEVLANLARNLRLPSEIDRDYILQVLLAREGLASTGIGGGSAIPHPRNPVQLHLVQSAVTLAFLEEAVDFRALDGKPVRLLFCLLAPSLRSHLHLLSRLGFALRDHDFRATVEGEGSREELFAALNRAEKGLAGWTSAG